MIPQAHITAWRAKAPWRDDWQVEQDLVLSRALVEIFASEEVGKLVALRGGTALHKLFLGSHARYSEDIDLVQRQTGPIGPVIDALRASLDPWLGNPKRDRGPGVFTITYRFESEGPPAQPLRLKIEVNTREHFVVHELASERFRVENPWFRREAKVPVFDLEELLATKLRALYQRRKGRDLFDLDLALKARDVDADRVVTCFGVYMERAGTSVTRAVFQQNLAAKRQDAAFREDVLPLLAPGVEYDVDVALEHVLAELIACLPGEPWRGTASRSS